MYLIERALITKKVFSDSFSFEEKAIALFQYQYKYNSLYKNFCDHLNISSTDINIITDIPHLPISCFKKHKVITGDWTPAASFTSSGTSGTNTSHHYYNDLEIYDKGCLQNFQSPYGRPDDYCFLALLPSYLERKGSSLIHMSHRFIEASKKNFGDSGFFLNNYKQLHSILLKNIESKTPTLLLGVSFGLLDFAEQYSLPQNDIITVMETGGMKGRRKEMTRQELHKNLTKSYGVDSIHSEYGMTELFSQAYSNGEGIFKMNELLQVSCCELNDPFMPSKKGKAGILRLIDLANIDSCAFIKTDDVGVIHENNQFEVLGRLDLSDLRGCNLMVM